MTKILLNGGYQSNLADIHRIFEIVCPKLGLPFSKFHEEEAALNGALTSVGIVVPEEIYGMLMDDKFHERYFNANIGDYYMISNPVAYNARIAVQAATATPAQILLNLETGGVSYELQDYADALRVTLATARLA